MGINKKRRIIIWVGIISAIVMFMIPPWSFRYANHARSNAGHGFILDPPRSGSLVASIDSEMLIIQLLGVIIGLGGIFAVAKDRDKGEIKTTRKGEFQSS